MITLQDLLNAKVVDYHLAMINNVPTMVGNVSITYDNKPAFSYPLTYRSFTDLLDKTDAEIEQMAQDEAASILSSLEVQANLAAFAEAINRGLY